MTLPNFLIIGAARSGTSSLYNYLKEHPDICMSQPKELHYFYRARFTDIPKLKGGVPVSQTLDEYSRHFAHATHETAIGEASPSYIFFEEAAREIFDTLGRIKIIANLRHPVDRAYSHFLRRKWRGREPVEDFVEAFHYEEQRIQETGERFYWSYKSAGMYHRQLVPFYELFGPDNIHINVFDDLSYDTLRTVQNTYHFLGVESSFTPNVNKAHNEGKVRGNPLRWFRNRLASKLSLPTDWAKTPRLSEQVRHELIEIYSEDIHATEKLTGKDLSMWLDRN